jgi:hypothetical protein
MGFENARVYSASGEWLYEIRANGKRIYSSSGDWKYEIRGDRIYSASLLSGYKSSNGKQLGSGSSRKVFSRSENTCKMGFFSKRATLRICSIV